MPPATNSAKAVEAPTPTAPLPAATSAGSVHGITDPTAPNARLLSALALAILACRDAPHDATNPHHRYGYTSAEGLIGVARGPLAANGLSLVTVGSTLSGSDGAHVLDVTYLLAHASGESLAIHRSWPVVVGSGRPLDKALAGAVTTCLGYTLRDVLLIERPDDGADSPDQRDDRDHKPAPKKTPSAPKSEKVPATAAELVSDIRARIRGAPFAADVERDGIAAGVDVKALGAIRDKVMAS